MNAHAAIPISDATFRSEVLESDRPVLVDFWAPWCPPCRTLGPTIEALATDLADTLKVGKIDVDDNPETASSYRISSLPTVIVFKNGQEVERIVGLNSRARYEKTIDKVKVG